jgi:hypothetical protein
LRRCGRTYEHFFLLLTDTTIETGLHIVWTNGIRTSNGLETAVGASKVRIAFATLFTVGFAGAIVQDAGSVGTAACGRAVGGDLHGGQGGQQQTLQYYY